MDERREAAEARHAENIREARAVDSEKVMELVFSVLEEYGLKPDPAGTDADLKDVEAAYLRRGGKFHVLEIDGAIVGSAGLYPVSRHECELRKMYLHRSLRGRGIGKLLLKTLLSDARRLGFRRVTLETASVLKEAIALYRSFGFREYSPEHLSARCDQAFFLEL
jgi:putative acetyltransferase